MKPLILFQVVAWASFSVRVATLAEPDSINARRADVVTVEVPAGTILGLVADEVDSFRGIPYAQPPEKSLRLKPPVRRVDLLEDFDATGEAVACPQFDTKSLDFVPDDGDPDEDMPLPFPHSEDPGQEDCLTVTVQRPSGVPTNASLPVLFWIFGGAFQFGSTQPYDSTAMLRAAVAVNRPFIFVAVNHRVGGFGFLGGKEILQDRSANLGLLDQRMGLEWVADNIEGFGGDPRKVTIWGQSAGSISVFDQMALYGGNATYKGKPLFRAAIMNSGSAMPTDRVDSDKAQEVFDTVVNKTGCGNSDNKLECLRLANFDKFYNATRSVPSAFGFTSLAISYLPRPDGFVLPDSPSELAKTGSYYGVPMIISSQEDEGTLFARRRNKLIPWNTELFARYLEEHYFLNATFGQLVDFVKTWPRQLRLGSPYRTGGFNEFFVGYKRMSALLGDIFTLSRRLSLEVMTEAKPDIQAWSCISSYLHPRNFINPLGTFHGSDLFYGMFGLDRPKLLLPPPFPAINVLPDPTFAINATRTYYLNFLYSLNPNEGLSTLLDWPEWKDNRQLLQFDRKDVDLLDDSFRQASYEFIKANTRALYL